MAAKSYTIDQVEVMFDKVIDLIKFEKMPLNKALKEPDTPAAETFYKWIDDDELKAKRYARACEARADLIFEEIIEIADDGTNDYMIKISKSGEEFEGLNTEHVQRSKLRIDARKFMVAKMNPKKYGEKLDVTTNDEGLNDRPQFIFVDKSGKKKK
jgi:hypothetical protein